MNRKDFLQLLTTGALASSAPSFSLGATSSEKSTAAPKRTTHPKFGDGRDWFFEKRFGMFIHWGLYAIHGFHEQEQWRARIPRSEYVKLAQRWNPTKFNPDTWLDIVQETGMKYVCLTTKHHDGFCLWDTKQTKFNTMNTPYGRDILKMLSDACHRRKIPLCLYYSIVDWNHPSYPNQGRHHELPPQKGDQPNWNKYMDFLRAQVRELCTNYGEIHGFWWDMNVPKHVDPSVNAMIRKLQPQAVINNRGFDEGDFGTPERDYDEKATEAQGFDRPTEACQSVGMESWGYRKEEEYYSDAHLLRSIDRYLCRDANYLLNVGPSPEGFIPEPSAEILKRIGRWYSAVKESLEDVRPRSDIAVNRQMMLTSRNRTLYIHLNKGLVGDGIKLKPINVAPKRVTLLNDGRKVDWALDLAPSDHVEHKAFLRLRNLPANEMANTVMVIKLEFDRPLEEIAKATTGSDHVSDWQK